MRDKNKIWQTLQLTLTEGGGYTPPPDFVTSETRIPFPVVIQVQIGISRIASISILAVYQVEIRGQRRIYLGNVPMPFLLSY